MGKFQNLDCCYVAILMAYNPGILDIDEEALRKQLR